MSWQPRAGEPVGPNEQIGRRIFELPKLIGARDQGKPPYPSHELFLDQRGALSVDRLGRTGIEKKVVRQLTQAAASEAEKRGHHFQGWYRARAGEIQAGKHRHSFVIRPAPFSENPYHAEIDAGGIEPPYAAYILREIFVKLGAFEPA